MKLSLTSKIGAYIDSLSAIAVDSKSISVIKSTLEYRSQLLEMIRTAKRRIYITALYLQDDEAGLMVLDAIYQAKQDNPELDVKIFVDFLRAQRGLMGHEKSIGNIRLYRELNDKYQHKVEILGVPVKSKEFLGVLHLKGFVFDDTLLYSGSSINNIYLQQENRYRYDRYHVIKSPALADSFVKFLNQNFVNNDAVRSLTELNIAKAKQLKPAIRRLKLSLRRASYDFVDFRVKQSEDSILATPLLGFGGRKNELNNTIYELLRQTEQEVIIFTPYFNFPSKVHKAVKRLLKRGKKVVIVVGDKTANDFYIPEDQPFNKVGILPYIYETSLRRFVKSHQSSIDEGLLDVCLWLDKGNSFHLKGISTDRKNYLITGHNINPRAWSLDIENGVLLQDPKQKLLKEFDDERNEIMRHCTRLNHFDDLETPDDYREEARKLLKSVKRAKLDSILNRLL